jgi:hypothetical protein
MHCNSVCTSKIMDNFSLHKKVSSSMVETTNQQMYGAIWVYNVTKCPQAQRDVVSVC